MLSPPERGVKFPPGPAAHRSKPDSSDNRNGHVGRHHLLGGALRQRLAVVPRSTDVREDGAPASWGISIGLDDVRVVLPGRPPGRVRVRTPRHDATLDSVAGGCSRGSGGGAPGAPPVRAPGDAVRGARGLISTRFLAAVGARDHGRFAVLRAVSDGAASPALVQRGPTRLCGGPLLSVCGEQRRQPHRAARVPHPRGAAALTPNATDHVGVRVRAWRQPRPALRGGGVARHAAERSG